MLTLRGIAIEGGALIATDQNGTSFRVEVDDTLRSRLRDGSSAPAGSRKLSPREIQTQIRAGMSADEVAKVTGAPLDYIQRYEGPVRPVGDDDPEAAAPTFGGVMGERLLQLSARGTVWSSWKEEAGGWVLKLSFSADSIDHDARWRFDPKKLVLSPLNAEAVALSQQGEIGASLMPRLRAVPSQPDSTRFDSGAFEPLDGPVSEKPSEPAEEAPRTGRTHLESVSTREPLRYGQGRVIEPRTGAISLAAEKAEPNETSDLLEALRRRRGEREASGYDEGSDQEESTTGSSAPVRVLERAGDVGSTAAASTSGSAGSAGSSEKAAAAERKLSAAPTSKRPSSETVPVRPARRGRTSMPSWDEIVFGARPDDE